MTATVLVVDDQSNIRRMLQDTLTAEGFRVITAENGQLALYAARHDKPDLILLDIMMPQMDGYTFLRTFRRESNVPVILLTAKMEESDKVIGLELGADDYVTKPFGMRELTARIRAALRRASQAPQAPSVLHAGEITLDTGAHCVTVRGKEVRLTPSEFELLNVLMSSPGRVFSRSELMENLRGFEGASGDRAIDIHIYNLRNRIETNPSQPEWIETVFGVGYRFRVEPAGKKHA